MNKEHVKIKADMVLIILLAVIAVFGLLSVTCYIEQYEQIYTLKLCKADYAAAVNEGELLEVEYEKRMDYRKIENYVSENLDMVKVNSCQIQYIVNDGESRTELRATENDSVFSRITKAFSVILEYFN